MFFVHNRRSPWIPPAALIVVLAGPWPFADAGGPESYDQNAEYSRGAIVIGSDGNEYRAVDNVKSGDPVTTRGGGWKLAHAHKDVVLDVPGRFKTVPDALAFLAGARVAESAKVVVAISPEVHELATSLSLSHSEGARIVLRGAGAKPADCKLVFKGMAGMVVSGGSTITIEKLSIRQQPGKSGDVPALFVTEGSRAILRGCLVEDCRFCCFVAHGSHLTASDCVFNPDGTADCFTVRNGSTALLKSCISRPKAREPNNTRVGFIAYLNSSIYCDECLAEGWHSGFLASYGSAIHLEKCSGSGNKRGAVAEYSSALHVLDSTFNDNEESGISALGATANVSGCRLAGNRSGAMAVGTASITFDHQPSTISNGRYGVLSKKGGQIDLVARPQFDNLDQKVSEAQEPQAASGVR